MTSLPSLAEAKRLLPGARLIAVKGCVEFQDPFDPEHGKRPCGFWIDPEHRDGWTVSDVRPGRDPIALRDKVREAMGVKFVDASELGEAGHA